MPFNFNIIPATIKALTKFVQVLDHHRFGAVMLLTLTVATIALVVAAHLPAVMHDIHPNTANTTISAPAPGPAAGARG